MTSHQIHSGEARSAEGSSEAIALFVASVLVIKILVRTKIGTGADAPSTYNWIYEHLFVSWAGKLNGSLFFALVTLLIWWVVGYVMYQRRWFVKV